MKDKNMKETVDNREYFLIIVEGSIIDILCLELINVLLMSFRTFSLKNNIIIIFYILVGQLKLNINKNI